MVDKRFAMDLAKLVVVAAWADGEVQHEELNALKHLVLKIPEVTSEDWRELEIYLDHPVTDEERDQLLANVLSGISSKADKDLVVGTLRELVEADGVVTAEEAELLEEVRRAVGARSTGLLGALAGLVRHAGRSLSGGSAHPVREDRVDDFVHNPIYFRVMGLLAASKRQPATSDEELRRACLAAGMMAVVAAPDGDAGAAEAEAMRAELASGFEVAGGDGELIVGVARDLALAGLDAFRLGQSAREWLAREQRVALLGSLFRVAGVLGDLDASALDRLRRLSDALGLTRNELAAVKQRA